MAEETMLIVGSIVIGILVFMLTYRFFIIISYNSLNIMALNEFNKFYSEIDFVCSQETKSTAKINFTITENTRVVYASDNQKPVLKVTENIKNGKISDGNYICMQFKNQQEPKCYETKCKVYMPYVGSLEIWNDFKLFVNKILGKPLVKEYDFEIKKTIYGVDLSYEGYDSLKVPVLAVSYIPLDTNGEIDTSLTGDWKEKDKEKLENYTVELTENLCSLITEGTIYKYFDNYENTPSLNYYFIGLEKRYEILPKKNGFVDLKKILEDIDICEYVDDSNVKEVWVWVYRDNDKPVEFSTVFGHNSKNFWNFDVDSDGEKDFGLIGSYHLNDLPVCKNSYTVYNFLITSSLGEIIGNYTHRIEKTLSYVDENTWLRFNSSCGTTDCPPNLDWPYCLYYWNSEEEKNSNCVSWYRENEYFSAINCHTWYGSICEDDFGLKYKIWWMQNIPGKNNGIKLDDGSKIKNWWEFIGNFDKALMKEGLIE
ncbi:MAG: hypothetical protein QXJ06_03520 [Candidatus Aenigmatarchaeota archaeon]|nr:hypothetical protein [Candidatus Aenigmarchaeota archaeon]